VQITSSSSENFCHFVNSFSLGKKSLGARTTHLLTYQLKHWLSSRMPALNYSITHCIRHSYSYCTINGWLENYKNNNSSTTESGLVQSAVEHYPSGRPLLRGTPGTYPCPVNRSSVTACSYAKQDFLYITRHSRSHC